MTNYKKTVYLSIDIILKNILIYIMIHTTVQVIWEISFIELDVIKIIMQHPLYLISWITFSTFKVLFSMKSTMFKDESTMQ